MLDGFAWSLQLQLNTVGSMDHFPGHTTVQPNPKDVPVYPNSIH
jgi:hypothetical protein